MRGDTSSPKPLPEERHGRIPVGSLERERDAKLTLEGVDRVLLAGEAVALDPS